VVSLILVYEVGWAAAALPDFEQNYTCRCLIDW
jgi:hypothetical protein